MRAFGAEIEPDTIPATERARRVRLLGLAGLGLPTSNSHLARVMAGTRGFPQAPAWAANPRLLQERLLRLKGLGLAEMPNTNYLKAAKRVVGMI